MNRQANILTTLGHPGRLAVFRLLVRHAPRPVRPGRMAEALAIKPNTLSVYLSALAQAGLVHGTRHGKAIEYRADLVALGGLVDFLVADCCRGRPDLCAPAARHVFTREKETPLMPETSFNVLFICTRNSARSIFAEALLRDLGGGRFKVWSAGTQPGAALHPEAQRLLERNGHDTAALGAKGVEEFRDADAPAFDFVFTVCDRAAGEECPPWPGLPLTAHWGMPDPARAEGSEAERALAFADAYAMLRRRIAAFANLPFSELDRVAMQKSVDEIGAEAGETA
ncbi:ArsR family transcriptional regulator [Maritimibacter sp. 55A14]|nr:ArsR family transcriptional regulator [Maritimibacter sp. 55A14]